MKKLSAILISGLIIAGTVIPAFAGTWYYKDSVIEVNYWDQKDWGVAYSGVVNNYTDNAFAACVKPNNLQRQCSAMAKYKAYVEVWCTKLHQHAFT